MTIDEIITRFQSVKPTSSGYKALCPVHGDHDPSLCIGIGHTGNVVMDCKSHHCKVADIVAAVGLKMSDLFTTPASFDRWKRTQPPEEKPPAFVYQYLDYDGKLLYEVCRYIPKTFKQRIPDGITPNGRKWGLHGTARVLYHLPELKTAIDTGATVILCEGEKDTDNVIKYLQCAATTCGSAGKWSDIFTQQITGSHVVMLPDNDEPGRTFMQGVAQRIHGVVASLRVLQLPGLPHKGDVSDWINSGGTIEQFDELVAATPFYVHDETAPAIDIGTLEQTANNEPDKALTDDMMKCLHALFTFSPYSFQQRNDDTITANLTSRDNIPLDVAATQFYNSNMSLSDHERVFLHAEVKNRHIADELVSKIQQLGTPRKPVATYTTAEIRKLGRSSRTELPVLGKCGSGAFIVGRSHCLTAGPSAGKTELLSQSAAYWPYPIFFITEDTEEVWQDRLCNHAENGIPDNPLFNVVFANGQGHSYIMDTLRASQPWSIIIVDLLKTWAGVDDENASSQWLGALDPWIIIADECHHTFIGTHHDRKTGGKDPVNAASGSNVIMSRFSQRLHLERRSGCIELSGLARAGIIKPVKIDWVKGSMQVLTHDEVTVRTENMEGVLLSLLDLHVGRTVKQIEEIMIAQELQPSEGYVKTLLNRLKGKGQVKNLMPEGSRKAGAWIKLASLELPTNE